MEKISNGRRGPPVIWTDDEVATLKANYDKMSASALGRRMGKTRSSIIGKAHRLDLPGRTNYCNGPLKARVLPRPKAVKLVPVRVRPGGTALIHKGLNQFALEPVQEMALDQPLVCQPVSLMDRRDDQCCWPLDDGMYCGLPRFTGTEYAPTGYCARHYRASVRSPSEHRKLNRRVP